MSSSYLHICMYCMLLCCCIHPPLLSIFNLLSYVWVCYRRLICTSFYTSLNVHIGVMLCWNSFKPKNLHTLHTFLMWLETSEFYPYPSRLLQWHWGNHIGASEITIKDMGKWIAWTHKKLLYDHNNNKKGGTELCASFIGHTVYVAGLVVNYGISNTIVLEIP